MWFLHIPETFVSISSNENLVAKKNCRNSRLICVSLLARFSMVCLVSHHFSHLFYSLYLTIGCPILFSYWHVVAHLAVVSPVPVDYWQFSLQQKFGAQINGLLLNGKRYAANSMLWSSQFTIQKGSWISRMQSEQQGRQAEQPERICSIDYWQRANFRSNQVH